MSKKIIYMDDMDENAEADAGTVTFALEGTAYEIDLSTKNATKLRSALAPFIAAARHSGRVSTPKSKSKAHPAASEQLQAIRDWAGSQGMHCSPKGRIPRDIVLAYEQAHAKPATKPVVTKVTEKTPAFSG